MHRLAWPIRFVLTVAAGAVVIAATLIGIAPRAWRAANAHSQLPVTLPDFQPLSQRTLVFDVGGNIIATFERENSQPVSLAQIPPDVVKAVLAVEDNEFYAHKGVNLRSFVRALLSNFSSDAPRQGASTITQQVVKNEFLAGLPRDGRYKLLQAHYASMLEKKLTKDEILERYLNTVFFGNNAYGVQAAAEVYFGKTVEQLTLVEGAFLAGLIRSPSGYDPIRRLEPSRNRFKQVVERLVSVHLLTKDQGGELADTWPIPEQARTLATISTKPTYYTAALRDYLLTRSNLLGETEQERANLLYRGGLRIYTTLDPAMQLQAEAARNVLPNNNSDIDAAMTVLDTRTGAIRAMVGGKGYGQPSEINMALVPRQTGSAVKFFILAAAYQAGAQPNDTLDGKAPCPFTDPNLPTQQKSFGAGADSIASRGVVTLAEQTWASINCAFVRLSLTTGLHRVVDTIYRMAASDYLQPGQKDREAVQPILSLATGGNALSTLDMASGFQTLANQGVHMDPYYIEHVDRIDGTVLYEHHGSGVQVLDPGVALTTLDTLKGVLSRGTARRALSDFPRPAAGKTGTFDNNVSSMFAGATPDLTAAVWVGSPDAYVPMQGIPEFAADGVPRVQGGTYPARIWRAFMEPATASLPVTDWPAPPPLLRKPLQIYLPGNQCLGRRVVVGGRGGTSPTAPPAPAPAPAPVAPLLRPETPPAEPPTTVAAPPPETTVAPPVGPPPVNTPPPTRVVLRPVDSGTTIAPDVLDPRAPLNTAPANLTVFNCQPKLPEEK